MQQTSDAETCRLALVDGRAAFAGGLDSVWLNTRACTAFLANSIELAAQGFGAAVKREYALDVYRNSTRNGRPRKKQGHLDLLATFPDGSMLAVEIDTSHKAWSVKKLRFAKRSGMTELWVRWDGAHSWERGIVVLNIESPRRNWQSHDGRRLNGTRACPGESRQAVLHRPGEAPIREVEVDERSP